MRRGVQGGHRVKAPSRHTPINITSRTYGLREELIRLHEVEEYAVTCYRSEGVNTRSMGTCIHFFFCRLVIE